MDEKTGEVISKKRQVRVRKGRRKKGRRNQARTSKPPKTVKKRLAQQLGICSTQAPNQNLPDIRVPCTNNNGLSNQRYQAGIPTLHLFGQRDEIDYFSGPDEDIGGPDYLVRRRARHSDVVLFRRAARRKGVVMPHIPAASTATTDVLGSILNSQNQFFSKNATFSVDTSTGKFKVDKKPDLKNSDGLAKETPYGGNNRNNDRRNNQPYSNPSYQGNSYNPYDNYGPSSTSENYNRSYSTSQANTSGTGGSYEQDMPQDYTQSTLSSYDRDLDSENNSQNNEQGEDSDIDIYSDIEESVSTSKIEEDNSMRPLNLAAPPPLPNVGSDLENENNDSENEMVIDTEKMATPTQDEEEEVKEEAAVTSSEDTVANSNTPPEPPVDLHSTTEAVQSSFNRSREEEDDEDEDGCPNFNIYSTESINLAKNTDISLNPDQNNQVVSSTPLPEPPIPPADLTGDFDMYDPEGMYDPEAAYNSGKESEPPTEEVYDPEKVFDTPEDSCIPEKVEDQESEKKEKSEYLVVAGEDCLEKVTEKVERDPPKQEISAPDVVKSKKPNALYSDSEDEEVVKIQNSFIVGDISTMTEDVSEEERSYTPCLDEKAENRSKSLDDLGTEMISDDEKNDFDESHEHKTASEGDALEINAKESEIDMIRPEDYEEGEIVDKNKAKKDKLEEKDNKEVPKPDKIDNDKNKSNKKSEKRTEQKEKQESFKKLSKSNKERNYRDKERSGSQGKDEKSKNKEKENSREKRKRKEIERYDVRALIAEKPRRLKDQFGRDIRKSSSKSRSRSYTPKNSPERRTPPKRRLSANSRERKRKERNRSGSRSNSRQRHRSISRSRRRRSRSRSKRKKKSKDRSKRRKRERSNSRTYTPTRKRRKEWEDRYSKEKAYSAEQQRWTPSLSRSPEPARHGTPSWTPPRALESADVDPRNLTVILQNDQNKKKKDNKRKKKGREAEKRTKRKKKDHTPPPSKEVFASGDNILVSVSFNKENERRERDVFTKKKKEAEDKEKKKRSLRRKKRNQELSTIKPVAIIDLERSPFRELTPSPKDIIVLSDEDHVEAAAAETQDVCDSSQQVASPENVPVYMTGPKTPPEPQVKFSISSKQPALRPLLNNPLHDPEEEIADDQEQEEAMREVNDSHKGPNTPPEPPNSPPSSPDAYDPFEPTKSRSPSPDRVEVVAVEESEKRNSLGDISSEKNTVIPSLTPPIADIQPADSQSSLLISRDSSKSPDQVNRTVQQSKSSTIQSFTPATNPLTSTPLAPTVGAPRINILSSTILGNVSSTIPQRAVLPNVKLSPVKISPVKNVVKSTPVKPMPNKSKSKNGQQNGGNESSEVISLDFDSPYSPGSSDYEDLFEPPPEVVTKKTLNKSAPANVKEPVTSGKPKNTFDTLFDTPMNKLKKVSVSMDKSKSKKSKGEKNFRLVFRFVDVSILLC